MDQNGPDWKIGGVLVSRCQGRGWGSAAFLPAPGIRGHCHTSKLLAVSGEGTWTALGNEKRTQWATSLTPRFITPSLTKPACLSLLLLTLGPVRQWPRGRQQSQLELPAAPPLSMPMILSTPRCPYCGLSRSSRDSMWGLKGLVLGWECGGGLDNLNGEIEGPILWPQTLLKI